MVFQPRRQPELSQSHGSRQVMQPVQQSQRVLTIMPVQFRMVRLTTYFWIPQSVKRMSMTPGIAIPLPLRQPQAICSPTRTYPCTPPMPGIVGLLVLVRRRLLVLASLQVHLQAHHQAHHQAQVLALLNPRRLVRLNPLQLVHQHHLVRA